jgi:hypothetical protein
MLVFVLRLEDDYVFGHFMEDLTLGVFENIFIFGVSEIITFRVLSCNLPPLICGE